MKKVLLGILVLAASFPLAASAQGRGRGFGGGMGRGWGGGYGPGPMALAALDLTAAQQKKIGELRAAHNQRLIEMQARLDVLRSEMAELWRADRPDRKAILAKHGEMDILRQQIREEGVDFRLAVMDLLTTDQLKQLKTWRGRRGPGKGRGLGPCGRGMGWGRGRGRGMGWGGGAGGGWGPGWWSQFDE